jgi:hypothetical protein
LPRSGAPATSKPLPLSKPAVEIAPPSSAAAAAGVTPVGVTLNGESQVAPQLPQSSQRPQRRPWFNFGASEQSAAVSAPEMARGPIVGAGPVVNSRQRQSLLPLPKASAPSQHVALKPLAPPAAASQKSPTAANKPAHSVAKPVSGKGAAAETASVEPPPLVPAGIEVSAPEPAKAAPAPAAAPAPPRTMIRSADAWLSSKEDLPPRWNAKPNAKEDKTAGAVSSAKVEKPSPEYVGKANWSGINGGVWTLVCSEGPGMKAGASIALAADSRLDRLRSGDVVRVRGDLVEEKWNDHLGQPVLKISALSLVDVAR